MLKNYFFPDIVLSIGILLTGAAEAIHLYGVLFGRPLSECALIFGAVAALAAAVVLACVVIRVRGALTARRGRAAAPREPVQSRGRKGADALLWAAFVLLVLSQLLFLVTGQSVFCGGDMTVETVGSFLQSDGLHRVNPLTGQAYAEGLPSRLKILCLPTVYASLCRIFQVLPRVMVWRVIPVLTLLGCYTANLCLGKSLFPGSGRKQLVFLTAVALLIWVGSGQYGMDGFGLLRAGWRGETLRNAVLIPYAISLCIRRKYLHALLCAAAEACIVWTLYGLGVCPVIIAGLALTALPAKRRPVGTEAAG